MSKYELVVLMMVVILPLWAFAAVKWWKFFNSPDGERYRKRRMQGPFVPLSQQDIADDEARMRK